MITVLQWWYMHDVHNIGNPENKFFNLYARMQFMSEKTVFYRNF